MKWLLMTAICALGCGTMPNPGNCRDDGEACAVTSDCCVSLACTSGRCSAPSQCSPTNCPDGCCDSTGRCVAGTLATTCGAGGSSCKACTSTQRCAAQRCETQPTCKTAGQFATSSAQCCVNLTVARFGTTCIRGDIGDPCTTDGECVTGLFCVGWCTRACTSDTACMAKVSPSTAGPNECVQSQNKGFICFPFCSSTSECAIYGPGLTCGKGNTPTGGTSVTVCG